MSGHTPGPWHVGDEYGADQLRPRIRILRDVTHVEGCRPTTYVIGEVGYPTTADNTAGATERKANARLIATSPELLEALKAVYAEVSNTEPKGVFGFTSFLPAHIQWQVREAIAKATGEQP